MPEVSIQNFDLSVLIKKEQSSFKINNRLNDGEYNDQLNDIMDSLTEGSLDDSEYHTIL